MEKRYQVFISSTSKDLQNARQEVSQALLRSDCFPAQMEQWPATDEEQFEFIKQIIKQCDYYIVISAGMYGSIHPETNLSYTEMEFDYAMELGIPTIRLLHRDPFSLLKGSLIESTDIAKNSLKDFRKRLTKGKMCAFWETPAELGREVILSLNDIKKRKPKDGWVRANQIASSDALLEISDLKRELSEITARQRSEIELCDVAKTLGDLTGTVTLTQYEHNPSGDALRASNFGDESIDYNFTNYIKTQSQVEFDASHFAHYLLFGLLFEKDINNAIRRGFAPRKPSEVKKPPYIQDCLQMESLENLLMALENHGVIYAGDKNSSPFLFNLSYAESYPWNLSEVGRRWIVANRPPEIK